MHGNRARFGSVRFRGGEWPSLDGHRPAAWRAKSLALGLLLLHATTIPTGYAATGDVISSFPAPDGNAFGLAWDGTNLWVAGNATDAIYEVTTAGAVVSSFATDPAAVMTGLTWDGASLWLADDAAGSLSELSTVGSILSVIPAPGGTPRGLTWDGTNLWVADKTGSNQRIYEVTRAGTVVSSFAAPSDQSRGLTWDGTYLWHVDKEADVVHQLTTTGTVVSSFLTPCGAARGITFDGTNFWISCTAGEIYQVEGPSGTPGVLSIVKRAFFTDGTPVSHLSTLPRGTVVKFLLYIDNPGAAVGDVSVRDVLDPTFVYESGTLHFDNSLANCAGGTCSPAEEATIFAAADTGTPGTDAVDADPVSFSASTIDGGDQNVANAPLNIAVNSVWAVVFEARMQ